MIGTWLGALSVAGLSETASPAARWVVSLPETDPEAVRVKVEVPSGLLAGRSQIRLRFLDRLGSPSRLRSITAHAGARELHVDAPSEDTRRIDLAGLSKPVVFEYTIVPTFPYGSPNQQAADARSRVTPALAVLRTRSVFAKADIDAWAHVRFVLPPGWVAVAPWKTEADGFVIAPDEQSSVEYIGLGPFEVREIGAEAKIRVGALRGQTGLPAGTIASIVEREIAFFGNSSVTAGSLVVVPTSFMRGGASGGHSAVQGPQPDSLAHEVFHWWNNAELTRAEAGWFHEGLTTYYGLKLARDAGAYTDQQMKACLADLNAEMRFLEADHPVSLAEASSRWRDRAMERLMYSKGALFTLLLERQLGEKGRTMDDAVRAVLTSGRRGLGNEDLKRALGEVYGGLLDAAFNSYIEKSTRLPDMEIGAAATGRSGCAYFQPSNTDL